MKKFLLFFFTVLVFFIISCEKEEVQNLTIKENADEKISFIDPTISGDIIGEFYNVPYTRGQVTRAINVRNGSLNSLTPTDYTETVLRGVEFYEPNKEAILDLPAKAEIMFHFDVSGSMGSEIGQVKDRASEILTTILGVMPQSRFGVSAGCSDYENYAFSEHCDLTTEISGFEDGMALVEALPSGCEQYGYQFTQLASQPSWSEGAQKIVISFLDEDIHAGDVCQAYEPNWKDLQTEGIPALMTEDILLIVIYSGGSNTDCAQWNTEAERTGGQAFKYGTVPDEDIDDYILGILEEVLATVDLVELKVAVEDAEYADWLVSCDPPNYENVEIPQTGMEDPLNFALTFRVPEDAEPMLHEFKVALVGDGAEYAYQNVAITVVVDSDEDGCIDEEDPHPYSIIGGMIAIDGCETEVPNGFVTDCSTMMDLLGDCAEGAANHGDYVSCVAHLTNEWKSLGLITGKEKGKIQKCAAHADIP